MWTPFCVELAVELLEHLGGGDVDVGDRLALEHDPLGSPLAHEAADLLAERAALAKNSGASQR